MSLVWQLDLSKSWVSDKISEEQDWNQTPGLYLIVLITFDFLWIYLVRSYINVSIVTEW